MNTTFIRRAKWVSLSLSALLAGCTMSPVIHVTNDIGSPVSLEFEGRVRQVKVGQTVEVDVKAVDPTNLGSDEIIVRSPHSSPRRIRAYDLFQSEPKIRKASQYPDIFVSVSDLLRAAPTRKRSKVF